MPFWSGSGPTRRNRSRRGWPRSCQLARYPRTLPPPLRRPLCPSWRAGFSPIPTKSGASRASGLICGSWERRRPGPASAASRSLQKIVGAIVGAASRTGREHLRGSFPLPAGLRWISGSSRQMSGVPSSVAAMWTSNSRSKTAFSPPERLS